MLKFKSMKYVGILIFIILIMMIGINVTAQDTITPGTPVEGTHAGEPQPYVLEAQAGQLLILSLESDDFDSRVAIAEGETELASDDDSGEGNNALLAYVVQDGGSYNIIVDSFFFSDGEGAFALNVSVIDPPIVPIDDSLILEPADEETMRMYAVFKGTAGTAVDISGTTVDEDNVEIFLYGTDASLIERDDNDNAANDALIRRVVLPDNGLYLIEVVETYDKPLSAGVELAIDTTEQLYLSETPQDLVLGNGEGQIGTEVYTIDAVAGNTYVFTMTIESFPDEDAGVDLELLDTEFFFAPELQTRHTTGITWEWLSNTTGTIRLDVHPNFFGQDIDAIHYTILMTVIEP